jgi:hypothetical protein
MVMCHARRFRNQTEALGVIEYLRSYSTSCHSAEETGEAMSCRSLCVPIVSCFSRDVMKMIDQGSLKEMRAQIEKKYSKLWPSDSNAANPGSKLN